MVTVSDKKVGKVTNADGIADYYNADVESARDYYPFGMTQPGREYTSNSNRYGFNGKEDDKSWGLKYVQDYGFRLYNPAIGRFLSEDPKAYKYSDWSAYNFVLGNPVLNIDPKGDTVKISHMENNFVYEKGKLFLNGAEYNGKISGFLKQTAKSLDKLASTKTCGELLDALEKSDKNIVIKFKNNAANFVPGFKSFGQPHLRNNAEGLRVKETGKKVLEFYDFTEIGSGGTVYWDPNVRPPASTPTLVLGHELIHGLDATHGMLNSRQIFMGDGYEQIQEVRTVYIENLIRREMRKKMRKTYSEGGPLLIDAGGNPKNITPPYKFE